MVYEKKELAELRRKSMLASPVGIGGDLLCQFDHSQAAIFCTRDSGAPSDLRACCTEQVAESWLSLHNCVVQLDSNQAGSWVTSAVQGGLRGQPRQRSD
jgi:hypothetical protein